MASGFPPPTYDYDSAAAGVQGPTSPLLHGHENRTMRSQHVQIQTIVPLAEVDKILPAGFDPIPNPSGSNTAQVVLSFVFQQRSEILAKGTFGPAASLFVTTTATNTNITPHRDELLQLAVYASDQALVDAVNEHFGSGSFQLADVEVQLEEKNGRLSFDGRVEDPGTKFKISASAECTDPIDERFTQDPVPLPGRFLGNGITVHPAFRIATQTDRRVLPVATARVKVSPDQLRLPGGDMKIDSLGPSVIFGRWIEIFGKLE